MKFTGHVHWFLLMTCLDFGGQRSRPQQVIELEKATASTLGRRRTHLLVLGFCSHLALAACDEKLIVNVCLYYL